MRRSTSCSGSPFWARAGWPRCCGPRAGQPQAGTAADAVDGDRGAGTEKACLEAGSGTQDFPLSVRDMMIDRPNHVWAADITYVPIGRGFLYLVAIIDWASRAVLAWRLSNTMDVSVLPCSAGGRARAIRQAGNLQYRSRQPNSPAAAFTGMLAAAGIRISMDGRGRWMDNVFIERLWRTLKYKDIYLKGYADGREARAGVAAWMALYNLWRPHHALGNRAPIAVGAAARPGRLWIGRCAWTTLARCPHPHSRRNSSLCARRFQEVGAVALPTKKPPPLVPRTGSTSMLST